MGSSKNFAGGRGSARGPLDTKAAIERWVAELAADVASRLVEEAEENGRVPTQLVVHLRTEDDGFAWQVTRRTPTVPHTQQSLPHCLGRPRVLHCSAHPLPLHPMALAFR